MKCESVNHKRFNPIVGYHKYMVYSESFSKLRILPELLLRALLFNQLGDYSFSLVLKCVDPLNVLHQLVSRRMLRMKRLGFRM